MDVTPQELRGTEIKEAWRGFNRDEVDDLLERAASTIEHLTRQVQELESRLASAPPAAASAAALPSNRDDAEMLQRTLLLAQRAADDAVNEAQARARQLVEESEARAQSLVSEAESTARRIADSERRRLDDEIRDLASRRDLLSSDAEALEAYVSGYRDRLREAIEADLARLESSTVEPPAPRPELHEVEVPPERAPRADAAPSEPARAEPERGRVAWEATRSNSNDTGSDALVAPLAAARVQDDEWPPATDSTRVDTSAARDESPSPSGPVGAEIPSSWLSDIEGAHGSPDSDAPAPWDHATAEHQPFAADTPIEAHTVDTDDDLDDDAFFASLREAVRDDAPLGSLEESTAFLDDQPGDARRTFRRRR
jgi:cell division septum initiation protein DivIVA